MKEIRFGKARLEIEPFGFASSMIVAFALLLIIILFEESPYGRHMTSDAAIRNCLELPECVEAIRGGK